MSDDHHIDIYCERTGVEFWSEPLNAITNAAFLVTAAILCVIAYKKDVLHKDTGLLILLIACIGIGSGLFHTYATRTTMLMDVLPILLFQISFLIIYCRNVIGLELWPTFRVFMVFVLLTLLAGNIPREWANGSFAYAPAFLFILGFGVFHYLTQSKNRFLLLIASGVFIISLICRSIDMYVCQDTEIGTHFLWHILNGVVLYLCTYVIICQKQPSHRAS